MGEIRSYFKGHPAYPPLWFRVLIAADFDPLRAQEFEEQLDATWWAYYWEARNQCGRAKGQWPK